MSSGSWSNDSTTSLTLPTGATNPNQRIVLDGTTDTILVYNASGALIASVASTAGTDGFGNSYPAGISASSGVTSNSSFFLYDGTPTLGNLIASITNAAGTDSFGNAYFKGLNFGNQQGSHFGVDSFGNVYLVDTNNKLSIKMNVSNGTIDMLDNTDLTFTSLNKATTIGGELHGGIIFGGITTPGVLPTTSQINQAGGIGSAPTLGLNVLSPSSTGNRDKNTRINLFPARNGGTTGSSDAGIVDLAAVNGTTAADVDMNISGSVVKTDRTTGIVYTWQFAGSIYGANWFDNTVFNGLGGNTLSYVAYRLDAEDNLIIQGLATTNGPGTTIMTLPAAYRPVSGYTVHAQINRNRAGVQSMREIAVIGSTGAIVIDQNPAAGDEYSFNVRIPLFHLP